MIAPTEIKDTGTGLSISWADGRTDSLTAAALRRRCPCATCVDEWTGQKRLDDSSVPDDLKIDDISLVGRYAVSIQFSDGHNTGLFTFQKLREIGG